MVHTDKRQAETASRTPLNLKIVWFPAATERTNEQKLVKLPKTGSPSPRFIAHLRIFSGDESLPSGA
ncbi:hypothetical protein BX600DRAFT_468497 [Xylariales sp. PMI_506]|nr:hypothetical protein BX600DRAFT_468497 [Xylariales sp. PMI_506]